MTPIDRVIRTADMVYSKGSVKTSMRKAIVDELRYKLYQHIDDAVKAEHIIVRDENIKEAEAIIETLWEIKK